MFIFDHAREMSGDHPHLYSFFKHENSFDEIRLDTEHETGDMQNLAVLQLYR